MKQEPLGYRNNNPLNIVKSQSKWVGLDKDGEGRFCKFISPFYGFRAAVILLCRSYYVKKWFTLDLVISHWAPSSENNTQAYIAFVLKELRKSHNITRNTLLPRPTLKSEKFWVDLIIAMTKVECGYWKDELLFALREAYREVILPNKNEDKK